MVKGTITGKRAREYESKIKGSKRSITYNKFILKNIKKRKPKVCDFACGPGNNIELLKNKAQEITGVDLSPDMIDICKKKFDKSIKLKLASITDTKLKSNYFDYVLIRMGLHHVKDKESVLKEAHRILKNDGKLIIIDKFYPNLFIFFLMIVYKLIFIRNLSIFREYISSKQKNEKLLSSSKFKIIKETIIPYELKYAGQPFMCVMEKE